MNIHHPIFRILLFLYDHKLYINFNVHRCKIKKLYSIILLLKRVKNFFFFLKVDIRPDLFKCFLDNFFSLVSLFCLNCSTIFFVFILKKHIFSSLPYGSKPNYSEYSKGCDKRNYPSSSKHRGASTSKKDSTKKFSHCKIKYWIVNANIYLANIKVEFSLFKGFFFERTKEKKDFL